MIRHSKKFCINGCNRYVFAYGVCIYCYRKARAIAQQSKPAKPRPRIARVSKKRQLLNVVYTDKKKEKWERLIAEKKNVCYFTGIEIDPRGPIPDFHHTLGRDGELLCDMTYAWPCYFTPHREFHDLKYDYDHLEGCKWYYAWLKRIEKEDPIIHQKELYKINKANVKVPKKIYGNSSI